MVKRIKGKQLSLPIGIAIGIFISVTITIAGAMLLGGLIDAQKMPLESLDTTTAVIHLIAAFAGSWISYLVTKKMRLMVSAITAGGYLIVLCGMTALIFGGRYQGFGLGILMVFAGLLLSILLGMKGKKGSIRKHKIPAYR